MKITKLMGFFVFFGVGWLSCTAAGTVSPRAASNCKALLENAIDPSNWTARDYAKNAGKSFLYQAILSDPKAASFFEPFASIQTAYLAKDLPEKIQYVVKKVWDESQNPPRIKIDQEKEAELEKNHPRSRELRLRKALTRSWIHPSVEIGAIQIELKSGGAVILLHFAPSETTTGPVPQDIWNLIKNAGDQIRLIRDFHNHSIYNLPLGEEDTEYGKWFLERLKRLKIKVPFEQYVITSSKDKALIVFKSGEPVNF